MNKNKLKSTAEKLAENKNNIEKRTDIGARTSAKEYLNAVRLNEEDRVERAINGEKTWKKIAFFAGGLAVISIVAVASLAPLKTAVPFLVRVDANTGFTDLVPQLNTKTITVNEAEDQYWLSKFVQIRESYNWQSIQHSYDMIMLMSDTIVANDYAAYINNKDNSPLYKLKDIGRIEVKVNGVTKLGSTTSQVRYTTFIKNRAGAIDPTYKPTQSVATLTFGYDPDKIKTVEQRLANPLGFTVTSYSVTAQS